MSQKNEIRAELIYTVISKKWNIRAHNGILYVYTGTHWKLMTEQEACIPYLRNQVALIRPKIIVCLGRISAKKLIREDFRITKEHGQWTHRNGIWMTAIYHPSALLRDVSKRPETFDDLISIRAKIHELKAKPY